MTIAFTPLPYADDALEPHISAKTLSFHYGKHHRTYVEKLNGFIEGTPYAEMALEGIVKASDGQSKPIFNNSAQTWNHGFYWKCLQGHGATTPSPALAAAIDASFGSHAALIDELKKAAIGVFGSGWVWLVQDGDKLAVVTTQDAGTPLTTAHKPLLVIDVWEHAYYLDQQNARPKYIDAVVDTLLAWDFASENFARESAWTY